MFPYVVVVIVVTGGPHARLPVPDGLEDKREYPCQKGTVGSGAGETRRTDGSGERGMRSLSQARARGWSCATLRAGWVHGAHAPAAGTYTVQMRFCCTRVLARTRSFRITAVRATLRDFPLATRASYFRLRLGLHRIATTAGM